MQATAKEFIIALDEGTTNAKAVVLDGKGKVSVKFSQPLAIQNPARRLGGTIRRGAGGGLAGGDRQSGGSRRRGKRCGAGYQQSTRNRHRLVSRQWRTH